MASEKSHYKKMVDKKLRIRQRIFLLIIGILLFINIHNVFVDKITLLLGVSGFLMALILGIAMSRIFKISWNEEKNQVIGRLDLAGIVLLILYISVEVGRNWIFKHWLTGSALNAFGLIILTGLLTGRYLGTQFLINKRIVQQRSVDKNDIKK